MEKEPSSASGAEGSRRPSVLYATFAILTLILAIVAVIAMVLRFGH
jgi:flagellar biogenesis protein FliO